MSLSSKRRIIRLIGAAWELRAGDMIYGLMSRDHLSPESFFAEKTTGPDRVFLYRILHKAPIVQLKGFPLWLRVRNAPFSTQRHVSNLYADSKDVPKWFWIRHADWHHFWIFLLKKPRNITLAIFVAVRIAILKNMLIFRKLRNFSHFSLKKIKRKWLKLGKRFKSLSLR